MVDKIKRNKLLIIGGTLSTIVALLHMAIVIGGPSWYRFFGAGNKMAQLAENGSVYPAVITIIIAATIALWALYAFSGVELVKKLPLVKPVLIIISIVYILRGIIGIPMVIFLDHPYLNELEEKMVFMIFSSVISLTIGSFYLTGTLQLKHI